MWFTEAAEIAGIIGGKKGDLNSSLNVQLSTVSGAGDLSSASPSGRAISIVGQACQPSVRMTGKRPVPPKMRLLRSSSQ